MKTAVVFLTKDLHKTLNFFCEEIIEKTNFDVYVIKDLQQVDDGILKQDRSYENGQQYSIISVSDDDCKKYGYVGTNIPESTHIQKDVIAMDKFLYLFSFYFRYKNKYNNVWVFEDDVFIPSVNALINLNNKYSIYDLVTANNNAKTDKIPDWHWRYIFYKIEPPYYYSMSCAIMLSKRFLSTIADYVEKGNNIFHLEAFFNTLAMQKELSVKDATELKSIVWQGDWSIKHFSNLPNNLFHPVKDVENHKYYRNEILRLEKEGLKLEVDLPEFLTTE